uniref:NB-ARC domain-containing protein n=1 Tax=Oryza meridionalis TaxID=40149 RepID=A0A0E0E657_9ORYZ
MESVAIEAARWMVGKALSPLSGGLVEAWLACSELGANVGAVKLELLYAQGMLDNARGRETRSPALKQLLLQLRGLAYDAEDVLDELDYFRIQDELYSTDEAADEHGLLGNARHIARNLKKGYLPAACSCAGGGGQTGRQNGSSPPPTHHAGGEGVVGSGCMPKLASSVHLVGKRLSCLSLANEHGDDDDSSTATHIPTNGSRFLCFACPGKVSLTQGTMKTRRLKLDRVDLSRRMKHIVEQLKPVCAKVSTILNLELLESTNRSIGQCIAMTLNAEFSGKSAHALVLPTSDVTVMSRPVTTSEFIEPEFYGRKGEKSKIIDGIQNDYHDKDLTVIPIVGLGGIGKTTLTQHIYKQVENHFDVKVWVCVSLNFNVYRLKEEIAKSIPKLEDEEGGGLDDLIEKRLKSKKFLLVLDDMWNCGNEDEWKRLLVPLKKAQTKGNIILVTTRFPAVAEMVKTTDHSIQLQGLEPEVFWELFQACVFGDEQSINGYANLLETGEKIVKKLKGSPLAAKTVGRLLRNHFDLGYWTSVLENKEWESQTSENDVMPALKLSYDYLSFHLKQCFTYCALFPEDHKFESEELIHLWIGLDILHSQDQNKRIEDIGLSYLNDLVNYGFLRKDENKDGSPYYIMHDLLHELALKVSSYECISVNSINVRSVHIPPSIRHLSIVIHDMDVNDKVTFENIMTDFRTLSKRLDVEKLHSLMLFGRYHGSFVLPLGDLLKKAKSLRVILLSTASYAVENMLHNFSNLVHLRYLRISRGYFPEIRLPNTISRFYHLRILDVRKCSGHFGLPRDMDNLVRLCHFLVPDDNLHSDIANVGKLKCLQELRRFKVKRQSEPFALRKLGQLELNGTLGIYNLENAQAADEAKLLNKSHLHKLILHWSTKNCSQDEHILESLKPHNNLQELQIEGHGGATCPSWLGVNLSIKSLQSLSLHGLDWNKFPPIGELWLVNEHSEKSLSCIEGQSFWNLKRLELVGIPRLAKWTGNDASRVFSQLEVFIVRDCPELIELPYSKMDCTQFPTLKELEIVKCPTLSSLPPVPWTNSPGRALIEEVGSDFQQLKYSNLYQSELCLLVKGKDDNLDSAFWRLLVFSNLTELKELTLTKCPPLPLEHLQSLSSLRMLCMQDLSNVLLQDKAENTVRYQFPVEQLRIFNCSCSGKELTLLSSHFPKLSMFVIRGCENIRGLGVAKRGMTAMSASSLPSAGSKLEDECLGQEQQEPGEEDEKAAADGGLLLLPQQLQYLTIGEMSELALVFDTAGGLRGVGEGLQGLHSIKNLNIWDCPNFLSSYSSSSHHSPFPSSLEELCLSYMSGMNTLSPLSNLSSLAKLAIWDFGDLRADGLGSLIAHGQLKELDVRWSPNFFVGSNLSLLLQLKTDDITWLLAAPVCNLLASSLTELTIGWNDEVEHFTKEQNTALLLLSSLQDLRFSCYSKLRFLPAGLHRLTSLKRLEIALCPAIRLLPKGGLPRSLKVSSWIDMGLILAPLHNLLHPTQFCVDKCEDVNLFRFHRLH